MEKKLRESLRILSIDFFIINYKVLELLFLYFILDSLKFYFFLLNIYLVLFFFIFIYLSLILNLIVSLSERKTYDILFKKLKLFTIPKYYASFFAHFCSIL